MHVPSYNTAFSAQVRHLGLLGPQLSQNWSQAKGEENSSEKVNSEPMEQKSLFITTSTVGIDIVISFSNCSTEFCFLDSNISKDLHFLSPQLKNQRIIHWTKHNKYSGAFQSPPVYPI